MSNFEDYDLGRGGEPRRRRPANRPSGSRPAGARPNGGRPAGRNGYSSRPSRSLDLDDEIELYEYGSEYRYEDDDMPARRSASSSARRASAGHSGSRPSGRSGSGSRPANHKKPASRPSRDARDSREARAARAASTRGGAKRPAGKNTKKKKMKRTIFVVEIAIILLLLIIFFLWSKFGKVNWDNINMSELENPNLDEETKEVLSQYTTLALFGVDNRSNGNLDSGNSDTIILVSINNDTKEVKMVSVQRDTYLQVEEDTYRKCNYAYNHGGVETALEMLNKNLDLNISGYVSVDFYAVAKVVDDLGGLDLEVTQKMIDTNNPETGQNALAGYIAEVEHVLKYYPNKDEYWDRNDCYFDKPGVYHMNGAQVVGYCRNRYAVDNDYGRAENQRTVIKLLMEKAKKANIAQLNKICDDVFPEISTSLSLGQCVGMATAVKDYEVVNSSGFPFALKTKTISKKTGSVVVPCTLSTNVSTLHQFMYEQENYDATDDVVDVISDHIVNETGCTESSAEINQTPDMSSGSEDKKE
ncbi:transcriptional attenuator, LytR family [Pseudobutyrivibrio sp. OR37]|uniref:LCP family protein n=1 Tax=Pseudobutyrivibrio sp. OR37 TaxID=1798186 RepID=UPI0008E3AF1E|nr:LCP family protein [Pseudobutyrivibrio sp. OR37]SFH95213.1 transcriptional attenuator, LytR family [Pseudobutyrivibrio sp. OR37]